MSTASQALPDLSSAFDTPKERIDEFAAKGHTLVRGICSREEIDAWRDVIHDATMVNKKEDRSLEERDTYHKAFLQVGNLWQKDPRVAGFTLAKRFGQIAADLLQVDAVRVYHDQALFKEPGGARYLLLQRAARAAGHYRGQVGIRPMASAARGARRCD